ncbi:MAG: PAS domain-containing protein, partial [Victivallales bacterium]
LPAHIAVIDREGRVITINQAWTDFAISNNAAGLASVDVGANYCNVCRRAAADKDADAEKALNGIESVLSGIENQFTMEYPCHSPEQQRWFLMTVVPFGSGGAVITHLNITERKQAEEALWESGNRLSLAQEISHLGSWELDLIANRLTWSDEVYRIFGLQPQEFSATYEAFLECVHPEDRAKVDDAYSSSLRENRDTYELEHRVVRKDTGEVRIVHERCQHFRDSTGKIVRSAGMVHDITERKRAEAALLEREKQLHTMADSIPNLAWWANGDGYITWYNRRWYEYTGTTPEQMEGWGWQSVHDPQFLPKVLEQWKASIATGQPFEMEFPLRCADGRFRAFLTRGHPLKDAQDRVVRWFGTNTDVDELKRAETALRYTLEDLQRSNRDLEQFAYVASHDLQEPLRMVTSFMGLLQDRYMGKLDGKADEYIGFAVDGANRMSSLIHDLLSYSRAGRPGAKAGIIHCGEALDKALKNLRVTIAEHKVSVTHEELPTVIGDVTQLSQLFQNLIGNAVKFRRDGVNPEIHVSAKLMEDGKVPGQSGARWLFSVRDNGIGIDPQFHEKVFMIFQRLHSRDRYPGTGIGLAICKKIVEHHGGRIWVESKPGEGSTFFFTIPQAAGDSANG